MTPLETLLPNGAQAQMASLLTARYPVHHGVVADLLEVDGGLVPAFAFPTQKPLLWDMLGLVGRRSLAINWPAGWSGLHPSVRSIDENAIIHTVQNEFSASRGHGTDSELREWLQRLSHGVDDIGEAELAPFIPDLAAADPRAVSALQRVLAATVTTHNLATRALESDDWDLLGVRYDALHVLGLLFAADTGLEESETEQFPFRHVWGGMHRFFDLLLVRLVELAGEDSDVVCVSPFGMHYGAWRKENAWRPADIYRQQGFLVAAGPSFKSVDSTLAASILDVTPTLLRLQGTSEAWDMPGRCLAELLNEPVSRSTVGTWDGLMSGDWEARRRAMIGALVESGQVLPSEHPQAPGLQQKIRLGTAFSLAQVGDTEQAIRLLKEGAEQEVDAAEALRGLIHLLIDRNELEAAADLMDALQREGDNPFDYHLVAARLASKHGDHEASLDHLFAMLAQNPENAVVHRYVAQEYLHLARPDDAMVAYGRSLEVDPGYFPSRLGLAKLRYRQGDAEGAAEAALDALETNFSDPSVHYVLARALEQLGRYAEAADACGACLKYRPGFIEAHETLASLLKTPGLLDAERSRYHLRIAARLRAEALTRPAT